MKFMKEYVMIGVVAVLTIIAVAFLLKKMRLNPLKDIERMADAPSSTIKVLYFYMNGCGHCETFMPEWNLFENDAKSSKEPKYILQAAKFEQGMSSNPVVDEYINKRRLVNYFPHVRLVHEKNGKNIADIEYKGERTRQALQSAVKNFASEQKL